ncbi:hypothetical protein [Wolbachia endosymbiont of Ctenocephalides felis wCfeT]|uniref:hypothetical protein n=1 Tax=Wolbachia endosymbiont of Ctenocephalides felis wCfeT TaxID=2732593 RepID=UPI001446F3A6|nr:hypothetical protein [Wolbachia endosymbiont of Ctenocephalides felis wCfeT]
MLKHSDKNRYSDEFSDRYTNKRISKEGLNTKITGNITEHQTSTEEGKTEDHIINDKKRSIADIKDKIEEKIKELIGGGDKGEGGDKKGGGEGEGEGEEGKKEVGGGEEGEGGKKEVGEGEEGEGEEGKKEVGGGDKKDQASEIDKMRKEVEQAKEALTQCKISKAEAEAEAACMKKMLEQCEKGAKEGVTHPSMNQEELDKIKEDIDAVKKDLRGVKDSLDGVIKDQEPGPALLHRSLDRRQCIINS